MHWEELQFKRACGVCGAFEIRAPETDIRSYFADPRSHWQRPIHESTRGLSRLDFPKGMGLSLYSQRHLTRVVEELNDHPRKSSGFRTRAEVMARQIRE